MNKWKKGKNKKLAISNMIILISYQRDTERTYMILDFTSEKMEHFLYLEVIIMMGKEAMMESRTTEQK